MSWTSPFALILTNPVCPSQRTQIHLVLDSTTTVLGPLKRRLNDFDHMSCWQGKHDDLEADSPTVALDPPKGWTNAPWEMDYDECWKGEDGDFKEQLETDFGLEDVQPLCTPLPSAAAPLFLIQSGSKYLIYNYLSNAVVSIEKPEKLEDIYTSISKSSDKLVDCLEMKELLPKET